MEGFLPFPECSRKASVNESRARYWLTLLDIETVKVGRSNMVPESAVPLLRAMSRLVDGGMSPSDASKKARTESPENAVVTTGESSRNDSGLANRMTALENAFLLMAGKLNESVNEVRQLRQENAALHDRLLALAAPKRETPAPIAVELPREVIVSQREISTWESVRITFNDVMGFLFGYDPGHKPA